MAISSVLSHLASYLWTPSKQRPIEEARIERMTIIAGARLDDYQVCKPRRRDCGQCSPARSTLA
jgi:hypothetical protein